MRLLQRAACDHTELEGGECCGFLFLLVISLLSLVLGDTVVDTVNEYFE